MERREPIAVIVSFDAKGHIAPLWLRIAGYKFKVTSYVLKSARMGIYDYVCKIIDENLEKEVNIFYNARDSLWYYVEKE